MAFSVVYDACILYPAPLRDLLLRIALTGIVRARCTEQILDECFSSLRRNRPDLPVEALALPDEGDRHVLAAAICCGARATVTFNLRDLPAEALSRFGIEAKHPDDVVLDAVGLAPGAVLQAVGEQAAAPKSPPVALGQLLDTLRDSGLEQSVARMRELFGAAR